MKYLITGADGFVGKHLIQQLQGAEIITVGRSEGVEYRVDLNDYAVIKTILAQRNPDYIIHLASDSSVNYSWEHPIESFNNNVNIFLNLIEAVRENGQNPRILSVGSSEQYGVVRSTDLPLTEESPPDPVSPYAVARVSQEMLSRVYVKGYGLDIIITRSFNHYGPGQDARFVIPSFARQLIEKGREKKEVSLQTGDLSIIRDFIDVRDVVRIYTELLDRGKSGEIYNVCSGKGYALREILEIMAEMTGLTVTVQQDPARIRPIDNPRIIGSNKKLADLEIEATRIPLRQGLEDVLNYWKQSI